MHYITLNFLLLSGKNPQTIIVYLGDFCGKRQWWFDGYKLTKPTRMSCHQKMEMLFYFDGTSCAVDFKQDFTKGENLK